MSNTKEKLVGSKCQNVKIMGSKRDLINNSKPNRQAGTGKQSQGKKIATTEVTCQGLTSEGKGIVQWDGKQLEVEQLLPGEKAEVTIYKKGRFFNAEIKRLINFSDDRARQPKSMMMNVVVVRFST